MASLDVIKKFSGGTNDLKKVLPKLLDEIDYYKSRTKKYIDEKYVDFLFIPPHNATYFEEGAALIADCQEVLECMDTDAVESLRIAAGELEQYKTDVTKIVLELRVLNKVLRVDELLASIKSCTVLNDNLAAIDYVFELEAIVNDHQEKIFRRLDCFEKLNERYQVEKGLMLDSLKAKFGQLVQLSEKQFQNNKMVNVKISRNEEELKAIILALVTTNFDPQSTCKFFYDNIFEPIITRPVSVECHDQNTLFAEMQLSFSVRPTSSTVTPDERLLTPNYKIVFRNLRTAWTCLNHMNIFLKQSERYIFEIFRDSLKDQFLGLLINKCLVQSIPETMDEMKEATLIEDILEMDSFLKEIHFLGEKDDKLSNFATEVGSSFRNKFSSHLLNSAVAIMRKDLSDMVLITSTGSVDDAEYDGDDEESGVTMSFARCMVSKSTIELTELMSKIVREIELADTNKGAGDDVTKTQLLSIISVILDRYITEVATHHKKLLATIPYLTALFYNNCRYLNFWTQTRESVLNLAGDSQLLVELKRIGAEHFKSQCQTQRQQILLILKEFFLTDSSNNELPPAAFRSVRQCLRQLDLLKNVWKTILPDGCYNKTMGSLLNDLALEIIRRVLAVEDIPAPMANGLVEVITLISERAPQIFTEPLRVTVIVESWSKLSQLKMILGARLSEITEHWAQGTGPLTLNFRAEEIKHLIRALFQNTKRRADALNTIV